MQCWRCGEFGHSSATCPKPAPVNWKGWKGKGGINYTEWGQDDQGWSEWQGGFSFGIEELVKDSKVQFDPTPARPKSDMWPEQDQTAAKKKRKNKKRVMNQEIKDEKGINYLGKDQNKKPPTVNEVDANGQDWELIKMKIDSGAIDTVIPKQCASSSKLNESTMSKQGFGYRAANGTPIKNHGERTVQ